MLFEGGFTFANFLVDAFAIFIFLVWIWLLITIFSDLFSRRDISAFGKVIWVIALIILPYIGIFAYILTQSGGMAERREAQIKHAQNELRQIVGHSTADEIEKLGKLKSTGAISQAEYDRLRTRLVQ
jgi:ABC-type multidrug transport system fused ATPase/permease subunit